MAITINDLNEQHITLQGPTRISWWDEDEHVVFEGDPECDFGYWDEIEEEWANWPIEYIWAASDGLHIQIDREG